MPLPQNGTAWPPKELAEILPKLAEYGAWYANDAATLASVYAAGNTGRRGVLQRVRDWFVGSTPASPDKARDSIHINLGQEIPRTSANLLFSEPAAASVADEAAQARLDVIAGPDFDQTVVSAAETSAALGGVYFRATWDTAVADHVFVSKVDADMAWPTFRWGRLVAVTFWRTVAENNSTVLRHLEHHELDAFGVGVVFHGLYEGTAANLGRAVPLTEHPATEGLALVVDADSKVSTLTPGLAVAYAPNITPSALWRSDPIGANLGRSDLEGIEQQLDALDELYSSWLRDIRLGKGRLIVAEYMLQNLGAGQGTEFDLDKTIFTPVKAAPTDNGDMPVKPIQFEIRTEDFERAIDHFRRIIVGAAGYSPQTFGITDSGAAVTATEVTARERLSYMTRDRKIRGLRPALERVLSKALAVDALVFPGKGGAALPVTVEFADSVQADPEGVARTNQLDAASLSASIETRVARANPDWTEQQITDEVALIKAQNGVGELADPDTLGIDGAGVFPVGATE